MLFKAWRMCLIAVGIAFASCGRIGVFPVSDERAEPADGYTSQDELDAAIGPDPQMNGASLEAGADLPDLSFPVGDAAAPDGGEPQDGSAAPDAITALDATVPVDASRTAQDAASGSDAALDASPPDGGGALDASLACGGARVLGLCWYLGAMDTSCQETCASRAGYDARTASTVGTNAQGGNLGDCTQVLRALGHTGSVAAGDRADGRGIGCHVWDVDGWWLETIDFDPATQGGPARIACACLQ